MLTKNEITKFDIIISSFTNEKAAKKLNCSSDDIKCFLDSIYVKLEVNNRIQAAIKINKINL